MMFIIFLLIVVVLISLFNSVRIISRENSSKV